MDKLGSLLVEYKNGLVKWNGCIGPKTEEKIALNIAKSEIISLIYTWVVR